jgi:hypothetical protein
MVELLGVDVVLKGCVFPCRWVGGGHYTVKELWRRRGAHRGNRNAEHRLAAEVGCVLKRSSHMEWRAGVCLCQHIRPL